MIPKFNADLDIIVKLSDNPNADNGLSPDLLKAEFDKAGNLLKDYINAELVPKILDMPSGAGLLKVERGSITVAVAGKDYQLPITSVGTALLEDGAVTEPKLSADAVTTDKIKDKSVTKAKLADGAVVTKGTGPLNPGSSPLATDLLYVQYE